MPRIEGLLLLLALPLGLCSQGTDLPLDNPAHEILDRLLIRTGLDAPFHPSVQPYRRADAAQYALHIDTTPAFLTGQDRLDLFYLFKDNNEWLGQAPYATTLFGRRVPVWPDTTRTQIEASMQDYRYIERRKPILGIFYPTPANFVQVNSRHFHLRLNPVLDLRLGYDWAEGELLFRNQRGVRLRAGVDDRLYLFFELLETQARLPNYINQFEDDFRALPGQGLLKPYGTSLLGVDDGWDYLNGQGYLGFHISRHVSMQFGYGRHFIGNGYRSLFLSDFSNNYLYLRLDWRVWKLHYRNIFTELALESANALPDGTLVNKRYMTAHYLSFSPNGRWHIGLFEAVVFARNNQYELHYLNPVILYRTVEQAIGSPDNVLLGLDAHWNFARHFQLYGQLMIDEFTFSELVTDNRGWWGNKVGAQAGLKYINAFGLDHLDLQAEYNSIRPYTYSFRDSSASYSHYNQALAHPLGANFREFILRARWQPLRKLQLRTRFLWLRSGDDPPGQNLGGNILLPSDTRAMEYGNAIGQGIPARTFFVGFEAAWQLFHNGFLDLYYQYRSKNSEEPALSMRTHFIGGGFRMNIFPRAGIY